MFQRRNPLNNLQNLRQALWPKMGWWRVVKYYRARVVRMSSSAESIALNMAGGSAMSFTPFFGIHIFGAMGFALLMGYRANIVAATVGTFVGNPWTFPFLLYSSYRLGGWVLGLFDAHTHNDAFNPAMMEQQAENIFGYFWDNFTDIFVPTAIGGSMLAVASLPIYYIVYLNLVRGAQKARRLRMKAKQKKLFNEKSRGDQ